jgi:hypothetical protein
MRSNSEELLQLNHTLLKILNDARPESRLGSLILLISSIFLDGQMDSLCCRKRVAGVRVLVVLALSTTTCFTTVLAWGRPVALHFLLSASETGHYRARPLA